MNSVFRIPFCLAALLALLLPAAAQPPGVMRGIGLSLSAAGEYHPADEADVGRAKWTADYRLPKVWDGTPMIGVEQEFSRYDFSEEDAAEFGDAVESARSDELSLKYRRALRGKWSFFGGASMRSSIESGAEWGEGVTCAMLGVWRYSVSEDLGLSIALIGATRLEDSPMVFPFPAIDWRITDRLSLRTERGVTLAWDLDGERLWVVEWAAEYDSRDFRLDDEGAAPRGVLRDNRIPVSMGVRYAPNPGVSARCWLGADAWREYELADEDGDSVDEETGSPAWAGGIEISFRL